MYFDWLIGLGVGAAAVVAFVVMLIIAGQNPIIGVPFLFGFFYFVKWLFRK